MTDKELRKLSRRELLELMVDMGKEIEQLKSELAEAKAQLEDRRVRMEKAGSIAEATVQLNELFQVAQRTADEYLASVKAMAQGEPEEK